VLSLEGITKRFGSLTANNDISIEIVPGRIHCLLGENGAGKSTLMNILFGLLAPDEGEVWLGKEQLRLGDPRQAMAAGIGMVHQHFMLIPPFTVAENMVLGHEPGSAGLLDIDQARRRVRELSKQYRLEVDPDALVEDLPVGIQQRVEILKSLALDARYLIFGEPTAVLTPQEISELMDVMRALRDEGRAIVFITHKLREVLEVADDITVIRRGEGVGRLATGRGRPQRHVSGNIGDLPVDGRGLPPRLAAQHAHASAVGPVEPQQDADRGGLTRPVGAEEAVDTARLHGQVQAVKRPEAPEVLNQAAHAHRRLAAGAQITDRAGRGIRDGLVRIRAGRRC